MVAAPSFSTNLLTTGRMKNYIEARIKQLEAQLKKSNNPAKIEHKLEAYREMAAYAKHGMIEIPPVHPDLWEEAARHGMMRMPDQTKWGMTDGVLILYNHKGNQRRVLKDWDYQRAEKVLKRLDVSSYLITQGKVPCPHRKENMMGWHDGAILCRACNCIISQNGKRIVPPTPLTI